MVGLEQPFHCRACYNGIDTAFTVRYNRTNVLVVKDMNRDLVRRLLLYIIDQLQNMEAPISTTRLVKLLYLVDLEYYRRHSRTLTGIDWVKYKHGPYFFELPNLVRSVSSDLDTDEVLTERGPGFTYRTFTAHDDVTDIMPFSTEVMIKNILDQWGYEDLKDILDHVYETMPTKYAHYKQPLDFTYETDHLVLQEARESIRDFVTLDELLAKYSVA